ncbi:MAG: hypothetical protein ACD_56C00069G0007 [uncultured bacterium]|nr:MAG: hypothetical protein ACD_56C00069G0007 [uncultured bacterium]
MEYIGKIKNKILNLSVAQKVGIVLLLLLFIVAGILYVNPKRKMVEMRNSQRRSDVVNILNAVYEYSKKNGLPESINENPKMICRSGSSCEGFVDISGILEVEKKVLSEVPIDPSADDLSTSGYQISKSANGRINVMAPLAENNAVIRLSK